MRRFSSDLIRELRKLAEGKITDNMFAVNLWGYHLTIYPHEQDKRYCDYQIDIRCDADEVIRFSRAKTTNEGKRSMAPTMPNPLRNEILPRQELDQLSEIIDGEFEPIQRKEGRSKGRLAAA
ncbi:hypothetical protein JCM19237_1159 [Photobacterium aphoticum]|uniref:Replication initiator protein RctB central region domain-containing protein n=1 Tax=Photobacterium aphoticum TaxID=754436 RepID=A0A090RAA7_9GAMM|nr:hypothetical protein JCM19237_1159 [Photobacterium aphoticum]